VRRLPVFTAAQALSSTDVVSPGGWPLGGSLSGIVLGPILGTRGRACRTDEPECRWPLTCADDIWYGAAWNRGVCCLPGQVACRGICRRPCPNPRHVYERVNCTCQCPNTFPDPCPDVGWKLNPTTCICECDATAPCPIFGQTRDPAANCTCACKPGHIPCQGFCCDPLTDPLCCGGCAGDTCDPFTDLCCNGVCTNICTDTNCGGCGRAVAPGQRCCPPSCTPTPLGTDANCSGCGDVCTRGRTCRNGSCQCPLGTTPCGPTCCPAGRSCCGSDCCAPGLTCCGGVCVDLQTDEQNCGSCGSPCFPGQVCVSGTTQCTTYQPLCQSGRCVCPPGYSECHGWCRPIPAYPACCWNAETGLPYACPVGAHCCNIGTGCCA
jgi:hypothetical protein